MKLPREIGPIHFVGIGGIGMSGIAEIMLRIGYTVQGSDASDNANVKRLRDKGLPVILISHNMPHVWEVADRIHIQRLARRAAVITPQSHTMNDGVAIMTGAMTVEGNDATKEAV